MTQDASRIFVGYRALGFHSNHIPMAIRYHKKHKENYVITVVGKAFHTYNCSRLRITSVSDVHPDNITCMAIDAYLVYTSCKSVIRAFERNQTIRHTYEGHEREVHILLPFGEHLISIDEDNVMKIWDIHSRDIYLEMTFDKKTFQVSAVVHPSTYLNKVLFGSRQGTMQIWNIKTNKLLYSFESFQSAITVLEQSPAVDVIAVGLESGKIILHNIKFDETVMTLSQEWGPVTAISFRTDGHPIMATGSTAGHIALWDLEERKLQSQMRDVHNGAVTGMKYLPSEPLMITSAADNSIKTWIFDMPDGGGRLLRQRCGHYAPPDKIKFYGSDGKDILSAGQDSTLKSFSTEHDRQNKNFGQATMNKKLVKKKGLKYDVHKLPPITAFAAETARQSEWDGIVACHLGCPVVTSWNYQTSSMGKHKIKHERFQKERIHVEALCVDVSSCGNFFVVGWNTGHVDLYNIQSGLHRGQYGDPTAHNRAVRGVCIDGLNQMTITASTDKTLKFWRFKTKQLLQTLSMESSVDKVLLHRESSMLAVSLDNFSVVVVDIDVRRIVRRFSSHGNRVTDMTFSSDARWLISSSMDSAIRTWDLPSGRLIDVFLVDPAPTGVAMSPTGTFLATAHVDDLGIYLWSNRTLYSYVSLNPLPQDYVPTMLHLPGTHYTEQDEEENPTESESKSHEDIDLTGFKSPEQISNELVTLSLLPHSRWKNLTNLELIKKRNKPKEPPKVAKSAPFFLPTVTGIIPKFAAPSDESKDQPPSRVMHFSNLQLQSEFVQLVQDSMKDEETNFKAMLETLKDMSPSAIDVELRSLAPIGGGSVDLMLQFMKFLCHLLQSNQDFELTQAYLGLFLKLHGDVIASESVLIDSAEELLEIQQSSWHRLHHQFSKSLCLLSYLKSVTL
ncbi:WD repeat-containing protein 36-like [Ptychodera flava]|uniref:WD repeat-containing protein 36-like n=1 Tax=Ptychodera flava TaxID=63121 RepID=UPI00396A9795